jgi:zinc D-Ala-D-Ala carboxypeptidase
MRLSPHFTLAEATASAAAQRMGNDNQPTPAHLVNLRTAAGHMEVARRILGNRAISVTSWYRNPVVNRAVGGVPTSHHALGLAVDFRVAGMTGLEAGRVLAASDLQFDQLIWYRPTGVLHLSFHPQMRRQVRTNPTTNAGAKLLVGLVP